MSDTPTNAQQMRSSRPIGPHYKWIALSNTTLGMLMATINSSIVLIALPAIFHGIGINPLDPSETNYLLWMLMGYLVITATLVVTFGRISDMFGRVRLYNLGFAIFTIASLLLFITPGNGNAAATYMIALRMAQGIGGGFLFANSPAILTDAFPVHQRGMAMGINQMAAILGSIIGLILGGVLSAIDWHLIFLVSVPFGLFGTVWAFLMLRETSKPTGHQHIDWAGNITFFLGLTIILAALNYSIEPYGSSAMGWGNPFVIAALIIGVLLLVSFVFIEMRVPNPMFNLSLFKIRLFALSNVANLLASLVRGGLQFMLIIWLQGIWLPLHGYNFADTPLWAGIYMLPIMIGFILLGPISGWLSDRFGVRRFAVTGALIQAVSFLLLALLPANFNYIWFAILLLLMGIGQGMFASPNAASIMSSVPASERGVASGMRGTFQNSATVISMILSFTIVTIGLALNLPHTLANGLTQAGMTVSTATAISHIPPISALFAAFLGYNPMQSMIPATVLHQLSAASVSNLTGKTFFPNILANPFMDGLRSVFYLSAALCLIVAVFSAFKAKDNTPMPQTTEATASILEEETNTIVEEMEVR
jgi:EmrB/QacA subfamily drug resistance transporter